MVEIRVNVEQDVNFSVLLHGSTVQKEAAIEFSCQAVLVLKSHQGANPSILSCFAYQGVGNPQPMLSCSGHLVNTCTVSLEKGD